MSQHLDIPYFRKRLEEMRDTLLADLRRLDQESANINQTEGYGIKNHPAEDASELFDRQRSLAIKVEIEDELQAVEHALQRIEEGTYGICEVTGKPIPLERLEARPAATTLVEVQQQREQHERDAW